MLKCAGMVLAGALPVLLIAAGCSDAGDDPKSPEFAAQCSAAYSNYYVEGGKGPAFEANAKKSRYWRDHYYSLTGMGEDAARTIVKIGYDLAYEHRKESIADRNKTWKQMMDACAPYET